MTKDRAKSSKEYFDIRRSRRISRQVEIVPVARQYLKLTKQGPLFVGQCPLNLPQHRGRERLFIVSPRNRGFYCFGCGRSGGVILLVMMAGGLEFGDAVRYLEKNFLPSRCLLQTCQFLNGKDLYTHFPRLWPQLVRFKLINYSSISKSKIVRSVQMDHHRPLLATRIVKEVA